MQGNPILPTTTAAAAAPLQRPCACVNLAYLHGAVQQVTERTLIQSRSSININVLRLRYHFIHVLQGCARRYLKIMLTAGRVKAPDSTCSLALPPNLRPSTERVTGADGFPSLTVDPEPSAIGQLRQQDADGWAMWDWLERSCET